MLPLYLFIGGSSFMRLKTFKRGIHPHDGKNLSSGSPIRPISAAEEMVYPLAQHIGAPAVPIVKAGDEVLAGQKIAEANGYVSVPIYSAVSGKVKTVGLHATATGDLQPCIVIQNDGLGQWQEPAYDPTCAEYQTEDFVKKTMESHHVQALTPESIRKAIGEAGIVGMGGAGFPAVIKLTPKDDTKIEYLIINGAECEPYLTSDDRLMQESGDVLLAGCHLLLKLFPNAVCMVGVENNKKIAIRGLTEKAKAYDRIKICPLKTKYPQGGERMLISALTGRKLNSSRLPADVGCVVVNVATVISAFYAVTLGRPLTHRVMTITGDAVAHPCNLLVPIGMSLADVLVAAGGFVEGVIPQKLINGGPMMGTALFSLDVPVTKTSASLLALSEDPVALHDTTACIRCGKCVSVCPEKLVPQLLSEAADREDFEAFEKYGGMECIECGSCAYVCPAKRHLVQSMRYGRRMTSSNIKARQNSAKGGSST